MTNTEIKAYIDLLNKANSFETIFKRQISQSVEVAKVWEKDPEKTDKVTTGFQSYTFFL